MPKTTFKQGIEVPKFDHSNDNVAEACGYTGVEMDAMIKKVNDWSTEFAKTHSRLAGKSETFEFLINNFKPLEIAILSDMIAESEIHKKMAEAVMHKLLGGLKERMEMSKRSPEGPRTCGCGDLPKEILDKLARTPAK